jgi:hypothetical protein
VEHLADIDATCSEGEGVRFVKVLVPALVILVIGSVASSRSYEPDTQGDPAAVLNVRTHVPAPVMSTMRRACFDCHSLETRWPWYSAIPVVSWLIQRDVTGGRGQVNFSRWAEYNRFDRADMLDNACDLAAKRSMPPLRYRMLHSDARLSATDIAALCAWTRDEATRLVQGES